MSYNIAIDGPAGAGKSTIAKEVAKRLNYIYVDTGAMYRAMALYLLREGVTDCDEDSGKISEACQGAEISLDYDDKGQIVLLNGENVNGMIRAEEVGKMASFSAANADVRKKLVELQRALARSRDVVMDGRDIGTSVLPDANIKIYLTASVECRAKRRFAELMDKGIKCNLEEIKKDIMERDHRDMTREISPLVQAEDAMLIDSSDMTIEQVVSEIMSKMK